MECNRSQKLELLDDWVKFLCKQLRKLKNVMKFEFIALEPNLKPCKGHLEGKEKVK